MKNKFLSIVCFIYSSLIIYVWFTSKLKYFLAPNMQIYLKLSLFLLIIMGVILWCKNSKFKLSDLFLLLPVVFLILSGDGKLTLSLANNRVTNVSSGKKVEENISNLNEDKVYDFTNVYFDVVDETYIDLANYITYVTKTNNYVGKTIKVRGFTMTKNTSLPKGYFYIGKYAITCCAADAAYLGFIAKSDDFKIKNNTWYEIEGVLEKIKDLAGYDRMAIKIININKIDSKKEEQYVYPCYSYSDGSCSLIDKYDLDY